MKASENPYKVLTWIPTGVKELDKLTGGVPTRKITEVSGNYSVGKSTLALMVVAQAQRLKMPCLWVDAEVSYDEDYASVLGVISSELDLFSEVTAEENLEGIEDWILEHENGLVVLDSVGMLLPRIEAEKDAGAKIIGAQSSLIARFCRKAIPLLARHNIALVVLNHQFIDIMSNRLKTGGGAKLEYAKSLHISLRKLQTKIRRGDVIEATIKKNKLSDTKDKKCELYLIFGEGFSLKKVDKLKKEAW